MTGKIHSVETFGALDGPGVRYVIFFQGCPLRCVYCHNPDSWDINEGTEKSVRQIMVELSRYNSFIRQSGVTLSGGEPLMQHEFLFSLLTELKAAGLHTAIDTSGAISLDKTGKCIDLADMLLLDMKAYSGVLCEKITGQNNKNTLSTLDYCEWKRKPVWIRKVIIPGLTDSLSELNELAVFLSEYECIQRVELLPFHKLGEYKWAELGREYTLTDTPAPTDEQMKNALDIFKKHGLNVI